MGYSPQSPALVAAGPKLFGSPLSMGVATPSPATAAAEPKLTRSPSTGVATRVRDRAPVLSAADALVLPAPSNSVDFAARVVREPKFSWN